MAEDERTDEAYDPDDPVVEETSAEARDDDGGQPAADGAQDAPAGKPLAIITREEPDLPMPAVEVEEGSEL